jgi:hypothetical protein
MALWGVWRNPMQASVPASCCVFVTARTAEEADGTPPSRNGNALPLRFADPAQTLGTMGYRELLKHYIRHLELVAGDNFIEAANCEPVLRKRDLGELRALADEIARDAYRGNDLRRVENYNYRLRVLINRHALGVAQVAELSDAPADQVRRWRTNPASENYRPMSEAEFARFERALNQWLERGAL